MALVTANQFQLTPDISGAISQGLQAGRQAQQFGMQKQQFQQQQEALAAEEKRKQAEFNVKSASQGAVQAKAIPTDEGRLAFLKRRAQEIAARQGDPSDTLEVIAAYEAGNPELANQMLDGAVSVGQQLGYIEAPAATPFQKGEAGMVFDPNTGTFSVDPVAKQRLAEVADQKSAAGEPLEFKDRQSLNKDVTSIIKNTVGIANTAKDISKLSDLKTGPASISIVFKFMKALDPTSVVREGEFATAENSAGIPEKVSNIYNKLIAGERLGPDQVAQFKEAAQALANSAVDSSNEEVGSLLESFGETIPDKFKSSLMNRIPKRIGEKPKGEAKDLTSMSDDELMDF